MMQFYNTLSHKKKKLPFHTSTPAFAKQQYLTSFAHARFPPTWPFLTKPGGPVFHRPFFGGWRRKKKRPVLNKPYATPVDDPDPQ